ncbi:MAG: VWA domain-containing protein [Pseudomonadota bacterium]
MSGERTLTDFIRALRSAQVDVSPAEAIDAARALATIGYGDRALMKRGLKGVLAKSETDGETYNRLFDLFFAQRDVAENGSAQHGGDAAGDNRPADGSDPRAPDLLDLAEQGDDAAIAMALERAGRDAGVQDIRFSTQTGYFAQQMMKAMGVERLEKQLLDRLRTQTEAAEADAERLMEIRRDMMGRARAHAQQQFDVYGAGQTEQFREDVLAEKSISALDLSDIRRMNVLVAKLARKLATRHSRRRRRKNRGKLDIRRTLRSNAGLGGVPFDLHWRQKRRDRPKFMVICDVSGSVARYVRFLLLLVHSLKEVVPDLHAYAFSARLKDVGDWLDTDGFEAAMARIIKDISFGSTDYGQALSDLRVDHWQEIDRRTTIIILGDGRSNYGDPRLDLFREATSRAKQTIWLCPEPRSVWGTGDSEMLRYEPHCSTMVQVSNLKSLERAIDTALLAYG